MLPLLPEKWVYGNKVPFFESSVVEFKEVTVFSGLFRDKTLGKTGLTKFRETIVAFLNGGKGYLFMGIKDDATIVGVENLTCESIDMLKLWLDSNFNTLIYTDGEPIDPVKVSIKLFVYPVENYGSNIILIECINTGKLFNIMTCSGTMIHRLNASNYKVVSEPVYRKREVKGMICSMQAQLRHTMAEKKRAIEDLKEKHQEEIDRIVKYERANIREYVDKISTSLYEKYREQNKDSFIIDLVKYLLCIK
jgi:hypothetical protein